MKRSRIYLFAFLFLFVALFFTFALALLSIQIPGKEFFDPIGQLPLFGPMLASLFFIMIFKNDKFSQVAIKNFDFKPLLKVIVVYFLAILIEKIIQLIFGFAIWQISSENIIIFNTEFNPIVGTIIISLLTMFFAGIGEEFGWRGYLFYKLKSLSWLEIVILLNVIWALWHLPLFIIGYMAKEGNILITFPLFTIASIEFGIIILYARIKTKSVISAMILHPLANIFNGLIALKFIRIENFYFAGWPNFVAVIVLLPFAIYYYKKGKILYEESKTI